MKNNVTNVKKSKMCFIVASSFASRKFGRHLRQFGDLTAQPDLTPSALASYRLIPAQRPATNVDTSPHPILSLKLGRLTPRAD
jgi:hypothetical protein